MPPPGPYGSFKIALQKSSENGISVPVSGRNYELMLTHRLGRMHERPATQTFRTRGL